MSSFCTKRGTTFVALWGCLLHRVQWEWSPWAELYNPSIFIYLSYICVYTTHACEPLQISKPTYPRQKIQNGLHCSLIICVVAYILEEINGDTHTISVLPVVWKRTIVMINKSGDSFLPQSSQEANKIDIPGEPLLRGRLDSEKMWSDLFTILSSSL